MSKIVSLPENFIGKDDHQALESFGAHLIGRGRATRFHWDAERDGDPVFEIFRGGADEELVTVISRDRAQDIFISTGRDGRTIAAGSLDYVLAELDKKFAREHGE